MQTVQLAYSNELGRHLLLARDVHAATTVLRQQPYAAVLYDDQVSQRCDFCFVASEKLMRCSRSKFAHYCSVAHQRAAWKAYYKIECAALVACAPNVPPATVRLAARTLWRRASEQSNGVAATPVDQRLQQQDQSGGFYADIEQLESHWGELDDQRKIIYAQMAVLIRQYMQGTAKQQQPQPPGAHTEDPSLLDAKHIAQLLARFACNNHTVCDEELRPIGVGIYPLGALINHSCQPNCVQSFEGPNIVFRSLSDLKAEQQITISYIELAATRQERRRQLLQQYFFDVDTAAAAATSDEAAAHKVPNQCAIRLPLQAPVVSVARLGTVQDSSVSPASSGSTAAAAEAADPSTSSCWLLNYPSRSKPPWPQDRPDKQLCQMLLLLPAQGSQHASGSMSIITCSSTGGAGQLQPLLQTAKLPGGMCLLMQLAAALRQGAAEGLFADLERAVPGDLLGVSSGDNEMEDQTAAGDALGLAAGTQLDSLSQSQLPRKQEREQGLVPQQIEVVQWGDWGSAAAAAGASPSTTDLAIAAANTMLQIWSLQQQADSLTAEGNSAAAVRLYQQALSAADGVDTVGFGASSTSSRYRVALGPKHALRARLLAGLLKAAVDEGGSWEVALTAAQQLTPICELVYPKVWPNLGLHYALTAKLALYLQQPAMAGQAATAAGDILCITHPSESQALQEVIRMRHEAQQEIEAYRRMKGQ